MEKGDHVRIRIDKLPKDSTENAKLKWPVTSKQRKFAEIFNDEILIVYNVNKRKDKSISSIQLKPSKNLLWDPTLIELVHSMKPAKRKKLWIE